MHCNFIKNARNFFKSVRKLERFVWFLPLLVASSMTNIFWHPCTHWPGPPGSHGQKLFSEQFGSDQSSHLKPTTAQSPVIFLISSKLLASALSFAELIAEKFTNYPEDGAPSQGGWGKSLLARVSDLIRPQTALMTTFGHRLLQMSLNCEDKTGAQL